MWLMCYWHNYHYSQKVWKRLFLTKQRQRKQEHMHEISAISKIVDLSKISKKDLLINFTRKVTNVPNPNENVYVEILQSRR